MLASAVVKTVYWLLICHFIGDYFLQSEYIAGTKGESLYHLIVHCALYTAPFAVIFGIRWMIAIIFVSHAVVDFLKCRKILSYVQDQVLHLLVLAIIFFLMRNGIGV